MITTTYLYLAYFFGFMSCFGLLWFLFRFTNKSSISRTICPKCHNTVDAVFKSGYENLYSNCKECGDKLVAW